MSEIKIIPMEREHIPVLARLERICFEHPWTEQALEEELDNRTAHFIVAVKDDRIIGYAGVFVVCESCYIADIGVFPEYRRMGAAKKLLSCASENAAKLGAQSISLEVRPSNEAAVSLYTSCGFEEVGLRKNFYRDPQEDALIMTKIIG